jgi:hypothetical protein
MPGSVASGTLCRRKAVEMNRLVPLGGQVMKSCEHGDVV